MKHYLLHIDKLHAFVSLLAGKGSVFYPTVEDGKAHMVRFDKGKKFTPQFTSIRTAENIKHFLFPSRDIVAKFPTDVQRSPEPQYIIGAKSCDMRGVLVYDKVFGNWQPIDPFYKQRRDTTYIISSDCPEPEDCCFCTLVGVNPYCEEISDMNITQVSAGLLCEVLTAHGEELLAETRDFFIEAGARDIEDRNTVRAEAIKKLSSINEQSLKHDVPRSVEEADKERMRDARDECVECYACLHACPTCYCFLLSDYKRGKDFDRVRTWDACYYAAYARVGGGANPRSTMDKRFWNRFQCKFNYFHQYEGLYACSGCGRCYRGCSAKIDIRKILWKL